MMQGDVYDEEHIASISSQLASAIDAATFGSGTWDEVLARFGRAFPGSWTSIHNMNFAEPSLNFFSSFNMDHHFIQTFQEHFAFVNPWTDSHWSRVKSGVVCVSEEVAPARLFAKTEFYNDWLAPMGADAATGMKIDGDRGEAVQLLMHFPLSLAEGYNRATAEVMARTRGNLLRSIDIATLMRRSSEEAATAAALVERGCCAAFVLDGSRRLREANQQAVELFASGRAISVKFGQVHLSNKDTDERFGKALMALSQGTPVDGSRISFWAADGAWQAVLASLPVESSLPGILSLLPPYRLVLVLVTALSANGKSTGDLSALPSAFGLTPSEVSFCRQLLSGDSVAEAAGQLGITVETARTRLKRILQKTGTSRQGQLMLLLSRLQ